VTTLNPLPDSHILDVAGGTGDIAFRCLDRMNSSSAFFSRKPSASGSAGRRAPSVTVCDINPSMLSVGKERGKARGYTESTGTAAFTLWSLSLCCLLQRDRPDAYLKWCELIGRGHGLCSPLGGVGSG